MSEVIREELQRFSRTLLSYIKFVLGGMFLATLYFFFYAGIKANYISIEILAAVFSTFSTLTMVIFFYVYTIRRKHKEDLEKTIEKIELAAKRADREAPDGIKLELLRREISQQIGELTTKQLGSIVKAHRHYGEITIYRTVFRMALVAVLLIDLTKFVIGILPLGVIRDKEDIP